jgi:tRNA dimethylallyltransferase
MIAAVICGPTGVGKSKLAIDYALKNNCEIISADSRQVYAEVPIGTAQVTSEEKKKVPHHLMGFLNPRETISHQEYKERVFQILKKNPNQKFLLVGGTGLYIKSVLYQQPKDHVIIPEDVSVQVQKEIREVGLFNVYQKLKDLDSVVTEKIHPNDVYRITKAYEYCLATGTLYSDRDMLGKEPMFVDVPIWTISMDRDLLYQRINQRVELMVAQGWVDEVRALWAKYPDESLGVWNALGYLELLEYCKGNMDLGDVMSQIKQQTRRFAKRQITFFKHQFPESKLFSI